MAVVDGVDLAAGVVAVEMAEGVAVVAADGAVAVVVEIRTVYFWENSFNLPSV